MSRSLVSAVAAIAAIAVLGQPAQAQEVYAIQFAGSNGPSTLYTIDTTSGTATMIGAIGFERCGAMDVSADGTIYAACERADGSDTPVLITIDPVAGVGTEVGPTGTSGSSADLSFRSSDDVLFLFDSANDPEHSLFTVDTGTGAATLVGDTGLSADGGNGMAFSPGDTLYHSATSASLNTLDQSAGTATFAVTLTMPGNGQFERLTAKDYNPDTGVMWAVLKREGGPGSPSDLVTVDTTTGVVTLVAPTIIDLDAIAWPAVPSVLEIPTVSPVGLMVLVLILGIAASLFFRRRTA